MRLISLTFDDALPEHLDVVAPILNEHGFHGTFYTHLSAPDFAPRAGCWKKLSEQGHELGNHTIFHPADSQKSWVTSANAIDDYSVERMAAELRAANDWLTLLDGKADRSFAYPCSNSVVGRHGVLRRSIRNTRLERTRLATWLDAFPGPGDTRSSYRSAAENLFTACRGGGLTLCDEIPATDRMDRFMLPSVSIENDPLENIQHFVNRGWSGSKWPILQFHGVGGDHGQNCAPKVFEKFVHWLASEGACVMTITNAASEVLPPAE